MRASSAVRAVLPPAPQASPTPLHVLPSADTLLFDAAPVFSNMQGNLSVTLTARRFIPNGQGGIHEEDVVVGFLRCSPKAAAGLHRALEGALLLASPAQPGPSN